MTQTISFIFLCTLIGSICCAGWGHEAARCERLGVPFCRGLRYNLTAMPNFMGHEDQRQAERGLSAFMPLVHYNCSKHLKLFLCAVFAPVCSEHVALQIPACKSLCVMVKRDCEPALTSLTLPWPHMLDCDRFLDRGNTLCVQPPEEAHQDSSIPVFSTVQQWGIQQQATALSQNVNRSYNQCPSSFVQTPDVNAISCSPKCGTDALFELPEKRLVEHWMAGWATLCFLSTFFTLLTFRVEVEQCRFRYPERPILFLALSYNLLSLLYIVRVVLGSESFSCVEEYQGPSYVPVHNGLKSTPCALWWAARHYLGLASSSWWMMLCWCWLLSARNEWSSEALHNVASYMHAFAWGFPILVTGAGLISRSVVADELTGLCVTSDGSAVWLEVLPHAVLLLCGCTCVGFAGAALFRVRHVVRTAGRSSTKLEKLMTRLVIFVALYTLTALSGVACTLYKCFTPVLLIGTSQDCKISQNCVPGTIYRSFSLEIALSRLFLLFFGGLTSGMWVLSGKTCRAWSRLLSGPNRNKPDRNRTQSGQLVQLNGFQWQPMKIDTQVVL